MEFLVETHFHTSVVSRCGKFHPSEIIPFYIEKGYNAIVITDHYKKDYFDSLPQKMSDFEKLNMWLEGYRQAKKFARNLPITIILGMEILFNDKPNDHLVFGIDEDFILSNSNLYNMQFEDFSRLCRKNKFFLGQAHPFRKICTPRPAELLDGIEVYNGHPSHNNNNPAAMDYAKKNNLIMISGSDFHEMDQLGRGGMYFDRCPQNSRELADLLFEGHFRLKTTK